MMMEERTFIRLKGERQPGEESSWSMKEFIGGEVGAERGAGQVKAQKESS